MRTPRRFVWAAACAFVVACGGMTTGQSDGAGSGGAVAQGGSAVGGARAGGTATGGTSSGGSRTSTCELGNWCSTADSTCVNGDVECKCQNNFWNPCSVLTGVGGTSGTGAAGTGANATGGNGSGGTATGGTAIGGACGLEVSSVSSPQVLFFAIDATGSMRDAPLSGSTRGQRKWDVLKTLWPELLDNLPETWAVGMMEWACPTCPSTPYVPQTLVPIAGLDTAQRDALKNGLTADVMGGYTPTECAYEYALDQVKNWQAPPEFVDAPRSIVLLTDGVPSVTSDCQTLGAIRAGSIPLSEVQDGELIATVALGTLDTGIRTFIGGVPGSDEPQGANYDPMYLLSLLAAAGGTALANCNPQPGSMLCPDSTVPEINALGTAYCDQHGGDPQLTARGTYCHFDLSQGDMADGLRWALKRIKAELVGCSYRVPVPPPPFVFVTSMVDVIYMQGGVTPQLLETAPANDCANGGEWYFSEQDQVTHMPTELELCPDACSMVKSDLDAFIDIRLLCIGGEV